MDCFLGAIVLSEEESIGMFFLSFSSALHWRKSFRLSSSSISCQLMIVKANSPIQQGSLDDGGRCLPFWIFLHPLLAFCARQRFHFF